MIVLTTESVANRDLMNVTETLNFIMTLTKKLYSMWICLVQPIPDLLNKVSIGADTDPLSWICASKLYTNLFAQSKKSSTETVLVFGHFLLCTSILKKAYTIAYKQSESRYRLQRLVACKWTVWGWTQAAVKWWGNSRKQESERAADFTERGGLYN